MSTVYCLLLDPPKQTQKSNTTMMNKLLFIVLALLAINYVLATPCPQGQVFNTRLNMCTEPKDNAPVLRTHSTGCSFNCANFISVSKNLPVCKCPQPDTRIFHNAHFHNGACISGDSLKMLPFAARHSLLNRAIHQCRRKKCMCLKTINPRDIEHR